MVGERLRLALGMPLRSFSEYSKLSDGIVENELPENHYGRLIQRPGRARNKCPDNVVTVTSGCQGCIPAHKRSLPQRRSPASTAGRRSTRRKVYQVRPLRRGMQVPRHHPPAPMAGACGVDAIGIDEQGRADQLRQVHLLRSVPW